MSEKYVLMRDDKALTELSSWTEAQEMERFMRRWHPGNAYVVVVEEAN
jgi:hypothetical protein